MEALYGQTGAVYAWLDEPTGRILGLQGQHLAFIDGDSVYRWTGQHIGWWADGHIRDHRGAVAVFTAGATRLGVIKPVKAIKPIKPIKQIAPVRPVKSVKPVRAIRRLAWASHIPF